MKPRDGVNNVDVFDASTSSRPITKVIQTVVVPEDIKITKPPEKKNIQNLSNLVEKQLNPPQVTLGIPKYNIVGIKKVNNTQYEQFSIDFARNKPKIYLIVEYIVDNKKIGNLIVFEKYKSASHYEIFKRNLFNDNKEFQRILFLNSADLLQETLQYKEYLHGYIGLNNLSEGSYYTIMDPLVKEDRIYEYKILASKVPEKVNEVDYDSILESKNLLNFVDLDLLVKKTLDEFSIMTLGSKELGWIIGLLNKNLQFFNPNVFTTNITQLVKPSTQIILPKSVSCIKNIFDDSIALFGMDGSLDHLLNSLGGLSQDFKNSFNESLNKINKTFSYNTFTNSIRKKVPVFELFLTIAEHKDNAGAINRLSQLGLTVPNKNGSEAYTSIEGLSKIFYFVNSIIYLIVKSQDDSSTLQKILKDLETPQVQQQVPPTVQNILRNGVSVAEPTRPASTISSGQSNSISNYLRNNGTTPTPSKATILK